MTASPSLAELTRVAARIGVLSFGGPAAQIALMHREMVELRPWIGERDFLGALSFCMLLPGPEAMQLATYIGWKLHGLRGGLIAGGLFVLPGAVLIAVLALGYAAWGGVPLVQAAFVGVKAAVVVIVFQALLGLGRKALRGRGDRVIAALAFLGIYVVGLPFPAIIALAALWGAFAARHAPPPAEAIAVDPAPQGAAGTGATVALWTTLWLAPLALLWLSGAQFLTEIALFFAKLAVVTFGGAYAVLAYMAQAVVSDHGWLNAQQMIDALGLAETTPGPLILVTEFTAIVAGHGIGGPALGLAAGAVALWMTFCPCFLWIFAGAPYIDRLLARPRLRAALAAITAAVVGVILNLALWFALHVLFAEVATTALGPLPVWHSLQPTALLLVALAAIALLVLRLPMIPVLGAMALLGVALAGL